MFRRSRFQFLFAAAVAAVAVSTGCAGLPSPFASKQTEQASSQTFAIPSVAPLGKTEETQKRGGVVISGSWLPSCEKSRFGHPGSTLRSSRPGRDFSEHRDLAAPRAGSTTNAASEYAVARSGGAHGGAKL
jgi:hypothetical protein